MDRLRYHCPPGSAPGASPKVVDFDDVTTMGTPASSAP